MDVPDQILMVKGVTGNADSETQASITWLEETADALRGGNPLSYVMHCFGMNEFHVLQL